MMTSHSKKKRETKQVDQKQARWTRNKQGGPETRSAILQLISENASITSREMANKLGINRSAVSKHLKKMQDNDIIHREGSQKSEHWVFIRQDTDLA